MRTFISSSFTLIFCLMLSGCLTSRLQLREDSQEQDASKPVAAQVQDVHSQGQYVIDELKSELIRLVGRVDDLEHMKQDPTEAKAAKEELKKLESRIVELEQAQLQMIAVIKKMQEAAAVAATPAFDGPAVFEKSIADYQGNHCDAAIEGFSEYLKNVKVGMIEDATFYRAECYYKLKQYKKAIVDYSRFPEKFNHSKHLPVTLLRIGASFDALGMKDDAKGFYQELIEKFPKSAEAKKAKAKMRVKG